MDRMDCEKTVSKAQSMTNCPTKGPYLSNWIVCLVIPVEDRILSQVSSLVCELVRLSRARGCGLFFNLIFFSLIVGKSA